MDELVAFLLENYLISLSRVQVNQLLNTHFSEMSVAKGMKNIMSEQNSKTKKQAQSLARSRYFMTWRWHFYAGLYVVPFMLMLCITGLVMLFDDEIEFSRYQSILQVVPTSSETVPVSQQLHNVLTAYPDASVTQFIPASNVELANRFSIKLTSGETQFITVNPYSGEVLGSIDRIDSWYQLANDIHGTLLIGDWGDYLIEIAASLGILLLVTGIYLWLPRTHVRRAGFLKLRMNNGPRILMLDLHANIGGLLSLVLLFFFVSGLAWSGIWGGQFVQAWSSFPAEKWDNVPLSTQTHKAMNHGSEEEVPWNLELTSMPESHDHAAMLAGESQAEIGLPMDNKVDQLLMQAKQLDFSQFKLNFPRSETGVYTITANTMSGDITDPRLDRTTHIDQYSGDILADVTWDDYNLMAKFMAAGIALHQGDISLINKVVNVFFCLAFILLAISGVVMWWIRRPSDSKSLGAPTQFAHDGIWKLGLVTLVVLALAFPLAGLTIITVLLLDLLIVSRVARLKQALS